MLLPMTDLKIETQMVYVYPQQIERRRSDLVDGATEYSLARI